MKPLFRELPLPPHYQPEKTGQVWQVPYETRAAEAQQWAKQHAIPPASSDALKIALWLVDVQNTFCIPGFELYVGGRSGRGAVEDNRRLAEFIYRNLGRITAISATLDTHQAMQIFHAVWLVNAAGEHPAPLTSVSVEDVEQGAWRFNPGIASSLGVTPEQGQEQLLHYVRSLRKAGKYDLTIWPYHAMLGGLGHAAVASIEEALFFHTLARQQQSAFIIKGNNPPTESYSAIGPEVQRGPHGELLARKNPYFLEKLQTSDMLIIAGQAKSHCVAWTIADLLAELKPVDPNLARKIYLLEDCTSPVVVPGVVDYTDQAEAAFAGFAQAGMHRVRSTDSIESWPG